MDADIRRIIHSFTGGVVKNDVRIPGSNHDVGAQKRILPDIDFRPLNGGNFSLRIHINMLCQFHAIAIIFNEKTAADQVVPISKNQSIVISVNGDAHPVSGRHVPKNHFIVITAEMNLSFSQYGMRKPLNPVIFPTISNSYPKESVDSIQQRAEKPFILGIDFLQVHFIHRKSPTNI